MSLDGCSNPPCLGAWIRERQVVLAKEPRGISEGFQEGAEALTHVQKISREQPDAAASLRVGTGQVPRCSLALLGSGCWGRGGQRGAFL